MSAYLDTDKNGKFILEFQESFRESAESLPTSRYRPGRDILGLQPLIEVWKQLKYFIDSGDVIATDRAQTLLDNLKKAYTTHRQQIRSAERKFKKKFLQNIPVPLKTTPYEHQIRSFGFSASIDASALFMEQGTGKTLVSIAIIGYRYNQKQIKRVVVACPKSVIPVWPKELRKHAGFNYSWDKVPKSSTTPLRYEFGPGIQILIINYDKLTSREKEIKKWKPDLIILDESHRIKNRKSNRSKVCHRLGDQVQYRLILTGTPLGQGLADAWSQYRFLNSNIFGRSFPNFRKEYCRMGGFLGKQIIGYKNIQHFADKIHSIAFRCTKEECLDLPECTSQNLYCEPDAETKRIYNEMNLNLFTEIAGEEVEVELQVSKLMKLRQIVGGIVKNGGDSLLHVSKKKLSVLQEVIEDKDWSGKLAIFVSFTHEINLIKELCTKLKHGYLVLSGATPEDDRFNLEEKFKNDSTKHIIIIQVDTGGEGLDFTPADMGVFYSPTFSFIKHSQIKARLHRIGQLKKVTYLNIIMEGTVDEDIVAFLEEHGDLTSHVLELSRNYKLENKTMNRKKLDAALAEIEADIQDNDLSNPKDKKIRKKKGGENKTSIIKKKVRRKITKRRVIKR